MLNRIQIRVEFGDCDPAKIVYFATYFRWFDRCTSALFRAAGLPLHDLMQSHGTLIPLVDVRARYLLPNGYGDLVVATSRILEWRRSSFVIYHRLLRDGILTTEGWGDPCLGGASPHAAGSYEGFSSSG